eukprot:6203941-Lingulodinium_polyedra.AAC.1
MEIQRLELETRPEAVARLVRTNMGRANGTDPRTRRTRSRTSSATAGSAATTEPECSSLRSLGTFGTGSSWETSRERVQPRALRLQQWISGASKAPTHLPEP